LFIVQRKIFVLNLTHTDLVDFKKEEEGIGEGKGKPEGDGEK